MLVAERCMDVLVVHGSWRHPRSPNPKLPSPTSPKGSGSDSGNGIVAVEHGTGSGCSKLVMSVVVEVADWHPCAVVAIMAVSLVYWYWWWWW